MQLIIPVDLFWPVRHSLCLSRAAICILNSKISQDLIGKKAISAVHFPIHSKVIFYQM